MLGKDSASPKLALRLLKDCLTSMGGKYILFLAVIMGAALVALAPPQLYRLFFQTLGHADDNGIKKLLVFGGIIALCSFIATALSIYAREWLRCEIETYLRKKVLSALCVTSLQKLESLNRGEWIACTSGDLIQAEDFLTLSFPDQLKNLLMFLGSCALFLYYGGMLGIFLLLIAFGLVFLNFFIQKKMQPALSEVRDLHGHVYQHLLENFEGLRTIRSFGGEGMVENNFQAKLATINNKSLRAMRPFALLIGTNELSILLGITAVLGSIIYQIKIEALSFDNALVYPFYMGIFFMSVSSFYRSNFDWTLFFTKGGRLAHLIYNFSDSKQDVAMTKPLSKTMHFSNIALRYEGHALLVPHFHLNLKQQEVLGIIGPSGCGKSTLLEFLAGLRSLNVDGVDTLLSTKDAAYVEQKPYIFEGTLAQNLRFGCNSHASDEQVVDALKKAGLTWFLQRKKSLNFYIQEQGQNLSEGERYRLGIARALLADKPFLLMDEPFAALDHGAIAHIKKLIEEERKLRGIVIVTHYLPVGLAFDRFLDFSALANQDFVESGINANIKLGVAA